MLTERQALFIEAEARDQGWRADGVNLAEYGWLVELHWPHLNFPDFWIYEVREWVKIWEKVKELGEIVDAATDRGWTCRRNLYKGGDSLYVEVNSPDGKRRCVRVGGMRTWKKLLGGEIEGEASDIIDARSLALPSDE